MSSRKISRLGSSACAALLSILTACGSGSTSEGDESCAQKAQCDDDNPCTLDECGTDGLCTHAFAGAIACTVNTTGDGTCTEQALNFACRLNSDPTQTACTDASQCDDGTPCTIDQCGQDGKCTHDSAGATGGEECANICGEVVPSDHIVDGIPAYAWCDAAKYQTIYSSNGVATRTTPGDGWVVTQAANGGYQCTEFAHRYMDFQWNVTTEFRDAQDMCKAPFPAGLEKKTTQPVHGDLIIFAAGVCGASGVGHVAVIDTVDTSASTITFVDENGLGRHTGQMSCALCYLHATANGG